jgi:hypothetical protein
MNGSGEHIFVEVINESLKDELWNDIMLTDITKMTILSLLCLKISPNNKLFIVRRDES